MKIAIRGHELRGKEVIQILESLGGKTKFASMGFHERYYYYVNPNGIIVESLITIKTKDKFKLYTLEEFEKEFPFKVGDEVIFPVTKSWLSGKIIGLDYAEDQLKYKIYNKIGGYSYIKPHQLSLYPMKEERNITLSFNKAKEWYSKSRELREIALQAYSEEELTKVELPKTWEKFCYQYSKINNKEYFIDSDSYIRRVNAVVRNQYRMMNSDRNICPSKESAEAHLAMIQLEQLRDCYRGLFVTVIGMPVWNISRYDGKPHIIQAMWGKNHSFLSFQSREVAEEYLKNFKPLIEKAGDLIS